MAKKLIFSTLLLLISLTTQVQSYFVRGAIYEKDGQFIVLFGDYHIKHNSTNEQHKQGVIKSDSYADNSI